MFQYETGAHCSLSLPAISVVSFKKLDSLLRGHPAVEIAACLHQFETLRLPRTGWGVVPRFALPCPYADVTNLQRPVRGYA
jgi:hypothetical protein